MSALALREDQDYWDDKQLAVLYQTGIGEDVSKAEMASFLHECQRRKLDPFTRQIYLIGRFDKRAGRTVYRSQTSIDGFRLIARRSADTSGIDYAYEDTIWFDKDGGRHEVWLSAEPPAAAKVVVVRNGNRHDAVARLGAYVPTNREGKPTGLWQNMPDTMIAKCAEALALRKAFPEDLGGLYTAEEMGQADNQTVTATIVQDAPKATVSRPAPAERPAPVGEADEDAQPYAEEAHLVRTLDALKDVHERAREAHKLASLITNPASGGKGGLGQYLQYRRGVLQKADKAFGELKATAEAIELSMAELDEVVLAQTGHSVEDATAEEMEHVARGIAHTAAGTPTLASAS